MVKNQMNHYFKSNNHLQHKDIEIKYAYKSNVFNFISDIGVFSKDNIDYGTDILLKYIPELRGSLLDIGCGYGCIGIILGKTYGIDVTLSDINSRAVELAKKNAEINGVKAEIIQSDGFEKISGSFDTIILNPPIHAGKLVVYDIYQNAYKYLNKNGAFYIIIQKKHGALSHKQKLEEIFGIENCLALYSKKGFYVFKMIKI